MADVIPRTPEGYQPLPAAVPSCPPVLAVDTGKSVNGVPPAPDFPMTFFPAARNIAQVLDMDVLNTDNPPTITIFADVGPVPDLRGVTLTPGGGTGGMDLLSVILDDTAMDSPGNCRIEIRNANGCSAMFNFGLPAGL